jgi:hypothetical protein
VTQRGAVTALEANGFENRIQFEDGFELIDEITEIVTEADQLSQGTHLPVDNWFNDDFLFL